MTDSFHNAPLRLFWWKAKPNFGDALSRFITSYISGRVVEHAGPKSCELFASGSILQIARRSHKEARDDGSRPVIWGSGTLGPIRNDFLDNVDVALLRGPLTATLLSLETNKYGDPGLLVSQAMPDRPDQLDRIGVIPHHSHLDDPALASALKAEPALSLIDVRKDPVEVCRQIAACCYVLSSSLHGLITADSFGISNTWIAPKALSRLKFYDYAASVGRALPTPVELKDMPRHVNSLRQTSLSYKDGIAAAISALESTFPASLRAPTLAQPAA